MDNKNVVVSVPAAKLLQIISIIPNLQLGRKIDLKCECRCLKYHNNKFFIYSENLFETECFKYPGIQALNRNGELLKALPIFDFWSCFHFTRNGNIVYSCYSDSQKYQIKCITQDNTDISSYPVSGPINIIACDDENVMIGQQYKSVSVINSDGAPRKVLVKVNDKESWLSAVHYNRQNNKLLVVIVSNSDRIYSPQLYRIEML